MGKSKFAKEKSTKEMLKSSDKMKAFVANCLLKSDYIAWTSLHYKSLFSEKAFAIPYVNKYVKKQFDKALEKINAIDTKLEAIDQVHETTVIKADSPGSHLLTFVKKTLPD